MTVQKEWLTMRTNKDKRAELSVMFSSIFGEAKINLEVLN